MPSLDDLLAQTMLFTAAAGKGKRPTRLPDGRPFHAPKPFYRTFAEIEDDDAIVDKAGAKREVALANGIWQFSWSPSTPGAFENVTCNTRGMGMDYAMAAKVMRRIEFSPVLLQRQGGEELELPLLPDFMLSAYWLRYGRCTGADPLWKLEAETDTSMVVAFGYQATDTGIAPLAMEEIEQLGDALMPATSEGGWLRRLRFVAGDPGQPYVCVGPSRYIVAIELVLCKERPDFVPGDIVSFARVHPHGFIWANEDLERAEMSIELERPRTGMKCGEQFGMKDKIGILLVTDANEEHHPSSSFDKPVPFTDNLYDYYCTEPREVLGKRPRKAGDHPLQQQGEVTLADSRHKARRVNESAVRRRSSLISRDDRDVRKTARQGQFDNVHLAARMQQRIEGVHERTLEDIVMINQCIHDCFHMHVRWGEFIEERSFFGWGPQGPYSKQGAPLVPSNQTVFLSFPGPSAIRYRALAEDCKAGEATVVCHHGAAYCIDEWPSTAGSFNAMMLIKAVEELGGPHPYYGKFTDKWVEFYWRVRYIADDDGRISERLTFPDLEKCMR